MFTTILHNTWCSRETFTFFPKKSHDFRRERSSKLLLKGSSTLVFLAPRERVELFLDSYPPPGCILWLVDPLIPPPLEVTTKRLEDLLLSLGPPPPAELGRELEAIALLEEELPYPHELPLLSDSPPPTWGCCTPSEFLDAERSRGVTCLLVKASTAPDDLLPPVLSGFPAVNSGFAVVWSCKHKYIYTSSPRKLSYSIKSPPNYNFVPN